MLSSGSEFRQEVRLIGDSQALRNLESEIDRAARSDAKVLVTGETGVGKEVVARLIHRRSARVSAPLVTLNCAGLPDSLLESELFGHARGSFTGAYRDKPGLLETAPNGTVFLDEVGEMSTRMQVVLLRFLETGEIQRVGGDGVQARVNVRLVTATNRDLRAQVDAGAFREDLYFRLNVIHIVVPPLRERASDVPVLVEHFLQMFAAQHRLPLPAVSVEAREALMAYRWPGNIRELKNVVERVVLKANGQAVGLAELPAEISKPPAPPIQAVPVAAARRPEAGPASVADHLTTLMLRHGQPFWTAVYPVFMSRDLTRSDLRRIIETGLEATSGNYRQLVERFNMPAGDYKRFLSFLRKHECHVPFQRFRSPAPRAAETIRTPLRAVK